MSPSVQRFVRSLAFWALPLCASNALAQWTPVIVDDAVVTYVDQVPSRRAASVKMTWLADYSVVQVLGEAGYFSRLEQAEYDCKRRRSRVLFVALRSGAMGEGHTIFSDTRKKPWRAIPAASFLESMWQIACPAR